MKKIDEKRLNSIEEGYLTRKEAAEVLNVTPSRVHQLVKLSRLTPGPYVGKETITLESLLSYIRLKSPTTCPTCGQVIDKKWRGKKCE